jgi:hypothetical protein
MKPRTEYEPGVVVLTEATRLVCLDGALARPCTISVWAALASQRVALLPRDIQLRLSWWGCRGPTIHNMGPCSRPGEDPNVWKQFGPKRVSVKAAYQRDVESGTESALSPRAAIHTSRRRSSLAAVMSLLRNVTCAGHRRSHRPQTPELALPCTRRRG